MYKRVIFGDVANPAVAKLKDIDGREFVALGLLAVAVLAMGVYPAPLIDAMHASVVDLLAQVAHSKFIAGNL
jgi:NADH-quinone oxidoreductase subunit M